MQLLGRVMKAGQNEGIFWSDNEEEEILWSDNDKEVEQRTLNTLQNKNLEEIESDLEGLDLIQCVSV